MDDETLRELRRRCTERQARFAEEYVRLGDGNASAAARAAGYKGTDAAVAVTASRLLKAAKVRAYIDALIARARPDVQDDIEAILSRLSALARGQKVVELRTKSGTIQVPAHPRDQIEAAKVILKVAGKLEPNKVQVELVTSLANQLEELRPRMSQEAYRELLAALARTGG